MHRITDVSLFEVLHAMEQSADAADLVAMSAVPWSTTIKEFTNYDLSLESNLQPVLAQFCSNWLQPAASSHADEDEDF